MNTFLPVPKTVGAACKAPPPLRLGNYNVISDSLHVQVKYEHQFCELRCWCFRYQYTETAEQDTGPAARL
jgi:hypothetical protein